MKLDKEHGDLGIGFDISKTNYTDSDLISNRYTQLKRNKVESYVLNANAKGSNILTSINNVKIKIDKKNTSFDFAEKFKQFIINNEFQANDNLIDFISSGDQIGKIVYERVQNFIGNNINVDSCHYINLISEYGTYGINIDEMFIKNIPDKLYYLVNILSLPKIYYKSMFYNMVVSDSEISRNIEQIKNEYDLKTVNDALNRKYFDNFYQNIAYPIIRNELYANIEDKKIAKYINDVSGDIYSDILYQNNSEFLFINLINNILETDDIKHIGDMMMSRFLAENINFTVIKDGEQPSQGNFISSNYFYKVLTAGLSYEYQANGELPTLDMTKDFRGRPLLQNINFENVTYLDVFSMFEEYACSCEKFVEILKIRLCAKKIANACNSICKLREEIKLIKEKDSKVGTALIIEELISDYIYKTLTKKVGLTNQKMIGSDLASAEDQFVSFNNTDTDKSIKSNLLELLNNEQKVIGVEFEQYLNTISEIVKTLKIDIIEYFDTTNSYLNIIPEVESIKRIKYYKEKVIECPPYLNTNGIVVYSDFNNTDTNVSFRLAGEFVNHVKQCAKGNEADGYEYYFISDIDGKTKECKIDTCNGMNRIYYNVAVDCVGTDYEVLEKCYLVQPENSFIFTEAKNLNRPDLMYSYINKWFWFCNGVDSEGFVINKIVDTYDRTITYNEFMSLVDASTGTEVIVWKNDKQLRPTSEVFKYLIQYPNGIFDYSSGEYAKVSFTKDTYTQYTGNDSTKYYGFFVSANSSTIGKIVSSNTVDAIWIPVVKTIDNEIVEIYNDSILSVYVQPIESENIIDSIGSEQKIYTIVYNHEFILDETGEVLGFSADKELYDSNGLILNQYDSDTELFYKYPNTVTVFKDKSQEVIIALDGNEPFWNDLTYDIMYSDKNVDEEADIIRFYKNIGLIDNDLTTEYKISYPDGTETLTPSWITARYSIISKLKNFWSINARHTWYDPTTDDARLESGEISKAVIQDLKNMDIAYHSNLGDDMKYNPKVQLNDSLRNLENWENNTVAIHPCVWNLVERGYNSYIKLYSISLYGENILKRIFSNAFTWPLINFNCNGTPIIPQYDIDGLFAFNDDETQIHNVNYWRNYSHSMFPYTTDYEASLNEDTTHTFTSRFIDFDGPFNYEALMDVIDKFWTVPKTDDNQEHIKHSIRNLRNELTRYYIDITV